MAEIELKNWLNWKSFNIIESFFRSDVTAVQVGASSGRDEIGSLIKRFDWQGLLIEPHPESFQQLTETYDGQKNVILENIAIAPDQQSIELFEIKRRKRKRPDTSLTTAQPKQMFRSKSKIFQRFRKKKKLEVYRSISCKSCRLDSLLEKHNIKELDWLVIDTESYDYKVLRSIDLDKYQPKIIIYEYVHLSESDFTEAEKLLKKHGYKVNNLSEIDRIAIKHE